MQDIFPVLTNVEKQRSYGFRLVCTGKGSSACSLQEERPWSVKGLDLLCIHCTLTLLY